MIPGNHDQVTLGGLEHALTPLQNAYFLEQDSGSFLPGILIFSHPTKFHDAFFVPHVRDIGIMQSILQSDSATSSSAVFVHADVTGAFMNDLIVSLGGIAPSYFPPHVPIYSGHFHKPHVVEQPRAAPGVAIRYVGSPYETTLAEARQKKALLVLDADKSWECEEEIALHIGRKHWRARNMDEFMQLPMQHAAARGDESTHQTGGCVSQGDKVVASVLKEDLEELRRNATSGANEGKSRVVSAFDQKVKALRSLGASVEIREVQSIANGPMPGTGNMHADDLDWLLTEDMSPLTTWSNFLNEEVERCAIKNSTATVLMEAGSAMLDEMEEKSDSSPDDDLIDKGSRSSTNLSLDTVTVEGFGPFQECISYPLNDRGLVLLRGTNRDGGSTR
jgi:hypothetical protein